MTPEALLDSGLRSLGIALEADARQRLLAFGVMVERWNRTFNLTAIRDPRRIMTHHLLDSLTVIPHLPSGSVADVGSGGGFPGLPIAIAQPIRPTTLIDSNSKKVAFLRQATIELPVPKVFVHEGRVESWQPDAPFDVVVSRAFADLSQFIGSCRHLLKPGGEWLAMKGALPEAEIAMLPPDVEVREVIRIEVPHLDAERHLIRISRRPA
jgi:16S rRNA (guanine527-N7)-methyltransferase